MNAIVEDSDIDPIWEDLSTRHSQIAERASRWKKHKKVLLPFVQRLILLGCSVDFRDADINVSLTGDKRKFLNLVRLHRQFGFKPTMPSKGATTAYWRVAHEDISFYVTFSSTVCRQVQVGTKLVEQPVYETQCDDFVPSTTELAEVENALL